MLRRPIPRMIGCLALGHYAWGMALLLLAAWFATSAFRILPHMSTGTIWTNLPKATMLAVTQAGPLGMLGMWIMVLGHWTWTGRAGLRTALLWTHGLLLLPGLLAVWVGIYALRAAARSAAQGGGLLGSIGGFPLAIGAGVVMLALGSIALALTVIPKQGNLKRPQTSQDVRVISADQ